MTLRRNIGALLLLALACSMLLALPAVAHAADTVYWTMAYPGDPPIVDPLGVADDIPVTGAAWGLAFDGANNGWAVGVRSVGPGALSSWYAFTSDGGSIWTTGAIPASVPMYGVAAIPSSSAVIAVGNNGTIARWSGFSWTTTQVAGWTTRTINAVSFADPANGWAVGYGGGILRTTNGGGTWTNAVAPGTAGVLRGVAARDASHVWAVGDAGLVRFWNGSAWTTQTSGTSSPLYSVTFTDATHGWAVGDNGTLLQTTDGTAWTVRSLPVRSGLSTATTRARSIAFSGAGRGFAVGDYETIWRTSDGGVTWLVSELTLQPSDDGIIDRDLRAVAFPSASATLPVAVGGGGLMRLDDQANNRAWIFRATGWSLSDSAPPVTVATIDGQPVSGWYKASVAVTLTASDAFPSLPVTTSYRLDGGGVLTYGAPVAVTGEMVHTLEYSSVDSVGNRETTKTATVRIDSTPPITTPTVSIATTYTAPAVITLSPSDPVPGSGVAGTRWAIDGGVATSSTAATTSLPGTRTLTWSSIDVAGNRETTKSATFFVTAPTVLPTSITIKTTATSVRTGNVPILSGAVTPIGMIGRNIVVWVKKPGRSYFSYSSNRTAYNLGGKAAWQYKYYFKPGMVKGYYYFKASAPAPGFASSAGFLTSNSPTTLSIRLR